MVLIYGKPFYKICLLELDGPGITMQRPKIDVRRRYLSNSADICGDLQK